MNKITRAAILGTAAIATVATSFEFASARDRYWRHHGRFHDRAVAAGVLGLTAGVVVGAALSQPRVVYRERRPVVVEEEAPVYADPDVVYGEPEADYLGTKTMPARVATIMHATMMTARNSAMRT